MSADRPFPPHSDESLIEIAKPKSKLRTVRESLNFNPEVFIAGEKTFNKSTKGPIVEVVKFYIAPAKETPDVNEVNDFAKQLFSSPLNLESTTKRAVSFHQPTDSYGTGIINFIDIIATVRKITSIQIDEVEQGALPKEYLAKNKTRISKPREIKRQTKVVIFPTAESAIQGYERQTILQAFGKTVLDMSNTY